VWVSALVAGDVHHEASRAWLAAEDAAQRPLVAPVLLLPEIAAAIAGRSGRPALARAALRVVTRIRSLRLVAVDGDFAEAASRLAAEHALRGADAVYVAVARQLALPLATWDRDQSARASRVVSIAPVS
jgi:predicted nucleic acid-binding protein